MAEQRPSTFSLHHDADGAIVIRATIHPGDARWDGFVAHASELIGIVCIQASLQKAQVTGAARDEKGSEVPPPKAPLAGGNEPSPDRDWAALRSLGAGERWLTLKQLLAEAGLPEGREIAVRSKLDRACKLDKSLKLRAENGTVTFNVARIHVLAIAEVGESDDPAGAS